MSEHFDPELDSRPWDEVVAGQRAALATFVQDLPGRTPFYAERLRDVDLARAADPDVWQAVPFTTKEDLRAAQQDPRSGRLLGDLQGAEDADLNQVLASSGTTGAPVVFGLTERDRLAWTESIANMWFTAGIRRGSVVALTTGMPLVAGGIPFADGIRRVGANLVWIGGQTPVRMASIMQRLRVDVLIGTASFVTFFAQRCSDVLGVPAAELSVRTIIGGGEPGMGVPEIREQAQRAWGADRAGEIMGIGDVMAGLWAECEEGRGMHFTGARNVFVELIDPDDGTPVEWADGAHGEAVYTTFTREGTPVVRFRSRDHLHVTATSCPCGRTAPVVRCVGRTDDMLIYKAMNVFPSAIRDVVLRAVDNDLVGPLRIRKDDAAQVRFDEPIPLEVELTQSLDDPASEAVRRSIEESVREQLRVRVAVELLGRGTIAVGDYKNALTYVRS